jgi:hypothetical protein
VLDKRANHAASLPVLSLAPIDAHQLSFLGRLLSVCNPNHLLPYGAPPCQLDRRAEVF